MNELQSLSAAENVGADAAILPVSFNSAELLAFHKKFFPGKKLKANVPSRAHFYMIAERSAEINGFITAIFATLQKAAALASQWPSVEHTADKFSQLLAANARASLLLTHSMIEADKGKLVKTFASTLVGKHVIYQQGNSWIVDFSGLPKMGEASGGLIRLSTGNTSAFDLPKNESAARFGNMPHFYNEDDGVIGRPLFKAALEAAQLVTEYLFGTKAALETAHIRSKKHISLDFDGADLLDVVNATFNKHIPGLTPFGPDFKLSAMHKDAQELFKNHIALLFVKEALDSAVKAKLSETASDQLKSKLDQSAEYNALVPVFGTSISILLSEEEARYVTQSPPPSKVSLYAFDVWATSWAANSIVAPRGKGIKGGGRTGVLARRRAPTYVIPPSQVSALAERRKKVGYSMDPGRSDQNNLTVSANGRLHWVPKSDQLDNSNAVQFESILEDILALSYEAGTPSILSRQAETHPVFAAASNGYRTKIKDLKSKTQAFAGCFQAMDWNYNTFLFSGAEASSLSSLTLLGTTTPDALPIYNFLKDDYKRTMAILFSAGLDDEGQPVEFTMGESTELEGMCLLYAHLFARGKIASLQDFIVKVAKERSLENRESSKYDSGLLDAVLTPGNSGWAVRDGYLVPPKTAEEVQKLADAVRSLLVRCIRDARGNFNTNLEQATAAEGLSPKDDPHYFAEGGTDTKSHELVNVFNYLGAEVVRRIAEAISDMPPKELLKVDPAFPLPGLTAQMMATKVLPFAIFISKLVPKFEEIQVEAEKLIEANGRNIDVQADDCKFPGIKNGTKFFPHQIRTRQSLGNHPRFTVLDIQPGGGKSILGTTDIMDIVGQKLIQSLPCVICPNGLVKNWCEEIHKFTDAKWNVIPVTSDILNDEMWGEERLTEVIRKAPRNTIVVIGLSVLNLRKYKVVIGNHVDEASGTLEFLKKFGFQYIMFDESHKAKNTNSRVHKAIKQLMTASWVKYVRIGTGTLIKDRLTDVVGQAALFNPAIFRTAREYMVENMERSESGALVWAKDTPAKARQHLSEYVSLVSVKRKEWAFMLPMPIETFIPVSMQRHVDPNDPNSPLDPTDVAGRAHYRMYEAILKKTMDDIKSDPTIMKLFAGKDEDAGPEDEDDDDDEDQDDQDQDDDQSDNGTKDVAVSRAIGSVLTGGKDDNFDDATMASLEALLLPYISRLEQMLVDPTGDAFGEIYFEGIDQSSFVSAKAQKIIERIRLNFVDLPWEKGRAYKIRTYADYEGKRYILSGDKSQVYKTDYSYVSVKAPPDEPSMWKEESFGKVIVFCRYTRSVNALFKALPPDLQAIAGKFHGEVANKWEVFEQFKSSGFSKTKGIQILIANEQAISEGHNLQMASRMIRCESPWAPGDLDQSASRIFRPDPKGEFKREAIFLDWIITNSTLEVPKMARLISKIIIKAQFDEALNPNYEPLNEIQLPLVSMSLDTIRAVPNLSDIEPYTTAYRIFAAIQGQEFREMRASTTARMEDIPDTPIFADAAIIAEVPYVAGQHIPDRGDFGLDLLNDYLENDEDQVVQQIRADKRKLVGTYVHTQYGNGVITAVRMKKIGADEGVDPYSRELSSVTVTLVNGRKISSLEPTGVYVARKVSKDKVKAFLGKANAIVDKEQERLDRAAARRAEKEALEEARAERSSKVEREARAVSKRQERATMIEKTTKSDQRRPRPVKIEPTLIEVELFPVVYNGFLAIEAVVEDDKEQAQMSKLGYKNFGDYAYTIIKDLKSFELVLAFLEKKFAVSAQTVQRLDTLLDSFASGRGRKFDVSLAPVVEFKNFYLLKHRLAQVDKETGKTQLRAFPMIVNEQLMIVVDLDTNPRFKTVLNKVIPGSRNKFESAAGLSIKFFTSKSEMGAHLKEMKNQVSITNLEELKTEFAELKVRRK